MTDHSHPTTDLPEDSNRDSVVDAWAILIIIALVVSTAVFWVSHQ